MVVGALVESEERLLFPAIESAAAVGTPIACARGFASPSFDLREAPADLASQLRTLLAVVEVKAAAGRAAMSAGVAGGNMSFSGVLSSDRHKRSAVLSFVLGEKLAPVERRSGDIRLRSLSQRRLGINGKLPIVRMLLAKIIAWFDVGIAIGRHINQACDNLLNLPASELRTDPNDEPNNLAHECGLSPFHGLDESFPAPWAGGRQPTFHTKHSFARA